MAADKTIADQIVLAVGGAGNIKTLGHCMTRLRFKLKDFDEANAAAIEKIPIITDDKGSAPKFEAPGAVGRAQVIGQR